MLLPELNNISPYSYRLSGFGGINRRETAGVDEFSDAVNLSSDEYPLIMPRKRYDVGLFQKVALMWHNNDRDMMLVPAFKSSNPIVVSSQKELGSLTKDLPAGIHGIVYTGKLTGALAYVTAPDGDEIPPVFTYELKPQKAYWIKKEGWSDSRMCIRGTIESVTGESYITYKNGVITIPEVIAFKNPVCANIGTSTVICDEINGMWVLEYDKDADTYTYNKVQNKYVVDNEIGGTSANSIITGGSFCHLRARFDDYVKIAGCTGAKTIEQLRQLTEGENSGTYINFLVGLGEEPMVECQWYRITPTNKILPVDDIIYEFCTIEGAQRFFKCDYVQLTMSAKYGALPDFKEEMSALNGMYEVIDIRENVDGVKWSVNLKGACGPFATMTGIINGYASSVKEGDNELKNNIYLADGMTIERKAPDNVRFLCSHQNRIWCNNGNNEIMCCARGNPYVWYRYEGNSLDSWAATIGGDGAFTGCINYGYPLFFKENKMFRVTGTRPSNFGYDEYSIKGIKNGCHDSAVVVNDVLYYQSIDGIYAYNASAPVCVSDKVWKNWKRGKACRFRDKYYIAVTEDTENRLYCYDTRSGIWHREDMNGAEVRYLYPGRYLDGYEEYMTVYTDYTEKENKINKAPNDRGIIVDISGLGEEYKKETYYAGYSIGSSDEFIYNEEDEVNWSFTTTDLLASEREQKYVKGIFININPYDHYSDIRVYFKNDDNYWKTLVPAKPYRTGRATWCCYPLPVGRCENLKLKIEGKGKVVIYNILLDFEKGSYDK